MNTKSVEPEFDPELLKLYLKMSPEERLKTMFDLNSFFQEAMPEKNKRAAQELRDRGL